jgi:hypothetical protein
MKRLKKERDDALRELQDSLAGAEKAQASLANLREQMRLCESRQARRTARALAADW